MHHPTDRIIHTTAFVTPVVEHWLEREIAQWVHPMKDRSDDPPHHERTLLCGNVYQYSCECCVECVSGCTCMLCESVSQYVRVVYAVWECVPVRLWCMLCQGVQYVRKCVLVSTSTYVYVVLECVKLCTCPLCESVFQYACGVCCVRVCPSKYVNVCQCLPNLFVVWELNSVQYVCVCCVGIK